MEKKIELRGVVIYRIRQYDMSTGHEVGDCREFDSIEDRNRVMDILGQEYVKNGEACYFTSEELFCYAV